MSNMNSIKSKLQTLQDKESAYGLSNDEKRMKKLLEEQIAVFGKLESIKQKEQALKKKEIKKRHAHLLALAKKMFAEIDSPIIEQIAKDTEPLQKEDSYKILGFLKKCIDQNEALQREHQ